MAQRVVVDHYAALELKEDADEATIKKSYRALVLKWHPDRHPADRSQAEDRIRRINTAYETLGNPTKRETYDLQRAALDGRRRGVVAKPRVAPRVQVPKEFMMQPVGFPDKFVRCNGRRIFAQSRSEVKGDFHHFFGFTKLSLWWVPDINNMCRIRSLGSKARGDKRSVATGVAGGLNIAFHLPAGKAVAASEVALAAAGKGQKSDNVNFMARPSPVYEGAMRFETGCRRGHYLAFMPPSELRVVPFLEEDESRVLDFMFTDFQAMFKLVDLEEVLLPAVGALQDTWVPLSKIQEDGDVKTYFKEVLQKPVWDTEDFAAYFEGHWTTWEYRGEEDPPKVRLRPAHEQLGQRICSAPGLADVVSCLNGAEEELKRLPVSAAVRALEVLSEAAQASKQPGGAPLPKEALEALTKLAKELRPILESAPDAEACTLPPSRLLAAAEHARQLGDEGQSEDVLLQCAAAARRLGERAVAEGAHGPKDEEMRSEDVSRLLRLAAPSPDSDAALAKTCLPLLQQADAPTLIEALKAASKKNLPTVKRHAAAAALAKLDSVDAEQGAALLNAMAEAGSGLDEVAAHVHAKASTMSVAALAATLLALAGHEAASKDVEAAAERLAASPELSGLGPPTMLALALGASKSSSLAPACEAVARAVTATAASWESGNLVKLLLAMVKVRERLSLEVREALSQASLVVLEPKLGDLDVADTVKLCMAASQLGSGPLLEAVATKAVGRLAEFPAAQLLLLTQALAQGAVLGAGLVPLRQLLDFWLKELRRRPGSKNAKGRRSSDALDLSAEQLAKLLQTAAVAAAALAAATPAPVAAGVTASSLPSGHNSPSAPEASTSATTDSAAADGSAGPSAASCPTGAPMPIGLRVLDAASAQLLERVKELWPATQEALLLQLRPGGALENLRRQKDLIKALQKSAKKRGRSPTPEKEEPVAAKKGKEPKGKGKGKGKEKGKGDAGPGAEHRKALGSNQKKKLQRQKKLRPGSS